MAEIGERKYCCTTTRGLCYWGAAFFIVYSLGLAAILWLKLDRYQLAMLFGALGAACIANFARNRTFHCVITGPFFLVVAAALALRVAGVWNVSTGLLWPVVLVVIGAAFLLERRFAS